MGNKKSFLNFKFFKYLTFFERLLYIVCSLVGLALAAIFVVAAIKALVSKDAGLGGLDFIFLAFVLLPFSIASRIQLRGLKRIPKDDTTPLESQLIAVKEDLSKSLSSSVKQFFILGLVLIIFGLTMIAGVNYFLNRFLTSKGSPPISEFIPPSKPCDPPREPKVLIFEPPRRWDSPESNTPITIYFNENMETNTFTNDNIKICTKLVSPLQEREKVVCRDIQSQGINPLYDYSQEDMKLTIKPSPGEKWGESDSWYKTWVEVTVTSGVKSICGLPITEPYKSFFSIRKSKEGRFIDPLSDFKSKSSTISLEIKEGDLVVEDFQITKEGEWYVARGVVKNNSQQVVQPVYVKLVYFDKNNSPFASSESLINRLYDGVVKPGERIPFELKNQATKPYASYTIEALIK